MTVPQPSIRPTVGFCLRTESAGSPPGRWYVNVCKHKLIEMPIAYSGKPVTRDWLLTHGIGNMQLPFDMGTFRKLKERSDGARHTTYCVDVVFNPLIVQLFMDDEFCNTMENYRNWIVQLALNRIEQSIGVKLCLTKVKLEKSFRYKDGEGSDNAPRDFTDLPGERQEYELDGDPLVPSKVAPPKDTGPLIEDVSPGVRNKPAMKKGFLKNADVDLYGPEGSKEGVLPENAGDPMGWMPKSLRQKSKIVDCNSPEYQASERQRKAAEEHNKANAEMRDTLTSGFESLFKRQQGDGWEADLPEGTDHPRPCKYDVDYSRFNQIEEEAEPAPKDTRDWYIDSNGQRCRLERNRTEPPAVARPDSGMRTEASAEAQAPAVKKGFLSDAKKSLYGPEGSSQAGPPPNDEQLMEHLGNLLRENTDPSQHPLAESVKPSTAPTLVKKPAEALPATFTLNEADDGCNLLLVVSVPGLTSMQDVNLDCTERQASLDFPSAARLRPLRVQLPHAVVPTGVRAKFSKKTKQINITLPRKDAT
eukprot:TRINITY_DN29008_c0_g1_i1.p1 TRINITY_DN29008_c0_g1~~TRINITY_DN29008_c0_g1_i1.p1  ORF type:complete len:585 (-),score=112.91 TRINITY_DN29008_c0_g1_i1:147-1742(-)